jgi:diguanylate cyclase (GGDEF)-like protein
MATTDNTTNLSLNELVAAMQYMSVGVTIVESSMTIRFWNEAFCRLLDFPIDLMRAGVTMRDLFRFNAERGEYGPGDIDTQVEERLALTRKFQPHQFIRTRPNGTVLEITGRVIYNDQDEMTGFVTLYRDLTVEKLQEQQVKAANKELVLAYDDLKQAKSGTMAEETDQLKHYQLAVRDPLTGLFNRHYLEDAADLVIRMHEHNPALRLSLLVFNVQDFSAVQKQYGHVGGEVVVRRIGALLARDTQRFRLAARCGDGCFVIFVADTDVDECMRYATLVQQEVAAIRFEKTMASLQVSVCASVVEHRAGETCAQMLARLD